MQNWEQLNTVRLILASIVAISHANYLFFVPLGYGAVFPALQMIAQIAVFLFFVLSGFVIGRSLQTRHDGLLRFLARRALRIFPPLLATIAMVAILSAVLDALLIERLFRSEDGLIQHAFDQNLGRTFTALITFGLRGHLVSPANASLWSLTLELQCYLAIGLIAQLFVTTSAALRTTAFLALALVALRMFYLADAFWPYYGGFFAGSLMSLWIRRLPKVLPTLAVDCSYSLFIMHFPIMLFFFFVFYSSSTPTLTAAGLIATLASVLSVLAALASARWIESLRWQSMPPIRSESIQALSRNVLRR